MNQPGIADLGEAGEPSMRRFLTRLVRLDPGALVRLRPQPAALWAMLPFRVLVSRPLPSPPPEDGTYAAADLLAGSDARRRDQEWRWPLPPSEGRVVETIPVAEVVRLAEAAARTVRAATTEGIQGRPVGERVLRDALLDHVAVVVTTSGRSEGAVDAAAERIEIPQRMIQALVRMGLQGVTDGTAGTETVTVRRAMSWIGLSSRDGSAWYRPISPLHLS